jgi:hypothetical protein
MSVLNRPMFMNKGGQMRHDERTIRNVDDELYRIAPKTHDRGSERIDAREEYARDLREKDYLRAQMNRLANGGQPMPMMAPPPMPMAPPPEAQVQMTEDAAAQQGEMLGTEYVDQMMTGIDSADSTEELIDAIRGNDKTLQDRYDELANFVGERDASATPESVLTLVQPTIMMTEQGAMDSGIGELMQGITGEVEMETEMGAPTPMGQGVGELMMSESVEEVIPEMNQGGPVPVQHFQDAGEVVSPRQQNLTDRMKGYEALYADALGFGPQDEKLAQLQIYTDIANRGLALAGGVNPNTGQPMTGNTLAQISQAAQGLPQTFVQAGAQKRGAERSLRQAALGQAISDQTAMEQAEFAESLRRSGMSPEFVQVDLSDGTQQLFNLNDPTHAALLQNLQAGAYTTEDGTPLSMTGVPTKIGTPKTPDRRNVRNNLGEVVGEIDIDLPQNEYIRRLDALADSLGVEVSTLTPDLTTFTTPALESARNQKLGTESVATETSIRDKASAARRANRSIDQARTILNEGDFQPGTAGETRAYISNLVDTFNIPVDTEQVFDGLIAGGAEAEAFQALSSQIVLDLESSLEGRVTDFRLRLIKEQVPTITVTKDGNLLLMDLQEEINRGLIDEQDIARRFMDRPKGVLDVIVDDGQEKTFDQLRDEYYEANPIVTEDIIAKLNANREVSTEQMERLNTMIGSLPEGQSIFDYIQANVGDVNERRRLMSLARQREGLKVDMDLLRQNFEPISVSESIDESLRLPNG